MCADHCEAVCERNFVVKESGEERGRMGAGLTGSKAGEQRRELDLSRLMAG